MKLLKKYACRGDGRAYIEYEATSLNASSTINVFAHTSQGNHCPAEIYLTNKSQGKKGFVLVLPLLENKIIVNFIEFTHERIELSRITKTIDPFIIKWESRINYRLNPSSTQLIRNIDSSAFVEQPVFTLIAAIGGSKEVVFQMKVEAPNIEAHLNNIVIYDKSLDVITPKLVLLSETKRRDNPSIDVWYGVLTFSIIMPNPCESFLITFKNSDTSSREGFYGFCKDGISNAIATRNLESANASFDPNYMTFYLRTRCTREQAKLEALHLAIPFEKLPLFSIVVPLFKTPKNFFIDMIESVLNQGYEKYELILINVLDGNEKIQSVIDNYEKIDNRIKVINIEKNQGITKNTYLGIQEASGDYIAFFDHDDILEPSILLEYAKAILQNKNIGMLYCDEDKLLPNGKYGVPYFKPDFSLYMLREFNYVCHLLTVKRALLEGLDINDSIYDGAQDHNLALQISETGCDIFHVKKVLYHWRISENSTSGATGAKSYANDAGQIAIERHLLRLHRNADVTSLNEFFTHNVRYKYDGNELVSIIIPTKDNIEILNRCVESIIRLTAYQNYEIILVENNSTESSTFDNYKRLMSLDDRIRVEYFEGEFNYSKINNFGISKSSGTYILALNNDTEIIEPDWLEHMVGICQDEKVGIVGAKLYYPDNTIQHAGVRVCGIGAGHINNRTHKDDPGYYFTSIVTREVSAVTGACLMIKRGVYNEVKGFDETFPVAFNDIDLCLKVRAQGLLVIYAAVVELYHYESVSRGLDVTPEKRIRLAKEAGKLMYKWPEYYAVGDPYHHPCLEQNNDYFKLASIN